MVTFFRKGVATKKYNLSVIRCVANSLLIKTVFDLKLAFLDIIQLVKIKFLCEFNIPTLNVVDVRSTTFTCC